MNLPPTPIAQDSDHEGSQNGDQHENNIVLGPLARGSLEAQLPFGGDEIFECVEDCLGLSLRLGKGLFVELSGFLTEQRIDRFSPGCFQVVDFQHALFLAGVIGDQRCEPGDIFPQRVASLAQLGQVALVVGRQISVKVRLQFAQFEFDVLYAQNYLIAMFHPARNRSLVLEAPEHDGRQHG